MTDRRRRSLNPITRRLLRAPAYLYEWHLGWLLGHRFLRLTHQGRRSGRRYFAVLEVVDYNPAREEHVILVARGRSADWYRNVEAGLAVEVAVARKRFKPECRTLGIDEAIAVLAAYERRNRIAGPLLRFVLGWLVHWSYDGTHRHRRLLAKQLPMVAFRPAHHASRQ